MISYLKGQIVQKTPTEVIVDVNGVGYSVTIPLSTFEKLEPLNGQTTILTYMHVREDLMQLYGFATEGERELFKALIAVSGIGPKMAQGILSGLSTGELKEAIVQGNISALTAISGIGRKTAERIIIELRDKLTKIESTDLTFILTSKQLKMRSEATVALMSLGHTRAAAEESIRIALRTSTDKDISVEELIKLALRRTPK